MSVSIDAVCFFAMMRLASVICTLTSPSNLTITVNRGSSVKLECHTNPLVEIAWRHQPKVSDVPDVIAKGAWLHTNKQSSYALHTDISAGRSELEIKRVQKGETGMYSCIKFGGNDTLKIVFSVSLTDDGFSLSVQLLAGFGTTAGLLLLTLVIIVAVCCRRRHRTKRIWRCTSPNNNNAERNGVASNPETATNRSAADAISADNAAPHPGDDNISVVMAAKPAPPIPVQQLYTAARSPEQRWRDIQAANIRMILSKKPHEVYDDTRLPRNA